MAPHYAFELLNERDVTEEKPTTPKAKSNRKGERVRPKTEEIVVEISDDPPSRSDGKSVIELNEAEVGLYKRTATSAKIEKTRIDGKD